jgi:hypothetical protein
MCEIEFVALLNAFHDITYYCPYFGLVKMRFLLHVSLVEITCQIRFAEFHENAVLVELWVDFVPPVVHSNDIF